MTRRFDLIVFDWDGTLMDSTATIASSIQLACRDLGLAVPDRGRAKHVIGLGLADALAYVAPDMPEHLLPQMIERYRFHYFSQDESLELFPGVRSMLAALRLRGHMIAVATGKNRTGLDRALQSSGLLQCFDATKTADESRSKPHPQMLLELFEHFDVSASRALMVGDTTHDLLMASNANSVAVAVTYGAHDQAELAALNPLALIESSEQLALWLHQHG